MNDPVQIRLVGAGGQGLITAGVILAEAAMADGKNVVQTQTYGPEARLGSSKAEVIISSDTIAYPAVTSPDVLICLSLEAAHKYLGRTPDSAIVLLDSTNIAGDVPAPASAHRLPITATALEVGSKVIANIVALAAANALAGLVSPESLRDAVIKRVPERFRELNQRAIEAGERLALPHAARL